VPDGLHHLTRHWLPDDLRGTQASATAPPAAASHPTRRGHRGIHEHGICSPTPPTWQVLERLGATDHRAAEQMIKVMGQRDLRSAFHRVYGSPTNSFNNNWLRRKLLEGARRPGKGLEGYAGSQGKGGGGGPRRQECHRVRGRHRRVQPFLGARGGTALGDEADASGRSLAPLPAALGFKASPAGRPVRTCSGPR
jgi:hypothetical protein